MKINESGIIETIGDHLRKKRLELGLFQGDVAQIIRVSQDTITYWETNRTKPKIKQIPKIIQFLKYNPIIVNTTTLDGQIYEYRLLKGLTQKAMGKLVGVNVTTIASWEHKHHQPTKTVLKRLMKILKT